MNNLRRLLRSAAVSTVLLAGWAAPPWAAHASVAAASLDSTADRVVGQPAFDGGASNNPSLGPAGLYYPAGAILDGQGNLYVADTFNHRVLEYDAPLTTGQAAARVFGQADFTHNAANRGGTLSASSLNYPSGVALDPQGNLYVADSNNNRVLEYDAPLNSDGAADRVFGQPSFAQAIANAGGLNAGGLFNPSGVAFDGQGNLWVADRENNRVLEYDTPLSSDRTADRVFGQADFSHNTANRGVAVSAGGLYWPTSTATDAAGNLYVADSKNNRVLEYDAPLTTGQAADRVFGQANGPNTNDANHGGLSASSLSYPTGVAVDEKGNLYVADFENSRVLEYHQPLTSGTIADKVFGQNSFIFVDNTALPSQTSLMHPEGVTVDASGNLWVADDGYSRVMEYDAPTPHTAPDLTALSPSRVAAGSPGFTLTVNGSSFYGSSVVRWNGSSRPTRFVSPSQLTAAIGAADLAGGGPFAVTVFTPAPGGGATGLVSLLVYTRAGHDLIADVEQGQPNLFLNGPDNPLLTSAAQLQFPTGLAVDGRSGRLFVNDPFNNRVLSWPNAPAFANGQPADLVLGQPNLLDVEANHGGRGAKTLSGPLGVALDGQGNLYVADTNNHRVLEYSAPLSSGMAASRVFGQAGNFSTGAANNGGLVSANSLYSPSGVALDALGNLYVADTNNNRVLVYDTPLTTDATADHVFGQPSFVTHDAHSASPTEATLNAPAGVALDALGNLYVADSDNNRVLEYDLPLAPGTLRSADHVFGQADFTHNDPNAGGLNASRLSSPQGVALDGAGSLYVADSNNSRVLEFIAPLSNSVADRVFGQPNFTSGAANNGGVLPVTLSSPLGLAVDQHNNLYVADTFNSRVLEYDWALAKLELPLLQR